MHPKIDEPIETKTTAQKINELSKQGSMNHLSMVAEAKHTGVMNQYCMVCGAKEQSSLNLCCMVARAGKRNGNRARRMACQDKERVPQRDKELETWDLNKTKVRIQVDRTKWQKRYPCRSRLVQRLRRHACQAVKGCKPEGQGIKKEKEKLLKRLRKTQKSLQSLRRKEGKSASSW